MIEGPNTLTTHLRRFFQNINNKNNNIAASLKATINEYLSNIDSNEALKLDESIIIELKDYLAYLDTAAVGSVVIGFDFQGSLPFEIEEILGLAELLDFSQYKAPSAIVSASENIVAGETNSAKSIYEQIAHLTRELADNKVPLQQQSEVKTKCTQWNLALYEKVSGIFLDSNSLVELRAIFEKSFNAQLCAEGSLLEKWRQSILDEIDALEKLGFFEKLFASTKLEAKYDRIFEHVAESCAQEIPASPTVKALLTKLYELIPDKAFKPFIKKLWTLSELPLERAAKVMHEWSDAAWQRYAGSELLTELIIKRDLELERLQDWQNANDYRCKYEDPHRTPGPLPLFELHCMKYSFHKGQDPKELYPSQAKRTEEEFEIETIPDDDSSLFSLKTNESLELYRDNSKNEIETIPDDDSSSFSLKTNESLRP